MCPSRNKWISKSLSLSVLFGVSGSRVCLEMFQLWLIEGFISALGQDKWLFSQDDNCRILSAARIPLTTAASAPREPSLQVQSPQHTCNGDRNTLWEIDDMRYQSSNGCRTQRSSRLCSSEKSILLELSKQFGPNADRHRWALMKYGWGKLDVGKKFASSRSTCQNADVV